MKTLPAGLCRQRVRTVVVRLGVAIGLQLPALCLGASDLSQTVEIKEKVIILHPSTKLIKPDRQALNKILATYDKSLFKIVTYRGGKIVRTQGQLNDALIDKTIASEVGQTKAKGNSHLTLQIIAAAGTEQLFAAAAAAQSPPGPQPGATTNPQTTAPLPGATTNPQQARPEASPGATTNPQQAKPEAIPSATTNPQQTRTRASGEQAARELIEKLKPILQKYSKK